MPKPLDKGGTGMRRRKSAAGGLQTNVRLDAELLRELEACAKANGVTFSAEVRRRLIQSLETKTVQGLAGDLESFKRQTRDAVENVVGKENIEEAWGILRRVDSLVAGFYAAVETELSSLVSSPAVRELLRGASPASRDQS
jgi:hypothetical protein